MVMGGKDSTCLNDAFQDTGIYREVHKIVTNLSWEGVCPVI